jgi:hypothetical protein
MMPFTKRSRNSLLVTAFAGLSIPHALKPYMKDHCASMPLTITVNPASPPTLPVLWHVSDAGHVSVAGTSLHFNECEIKLVDGGHFRVSFSYFLHLAVWGIH